MAEDPLRATAKGDITTAWSRVAAGAGGNAATFGRSEREGSLTALHHAGDLGKGETA